METFLETQDKIKIAINHYFGHSNSVIIICPGWFMTKDSAIFKNMSKELFNSSEFDIITIDFRGTGKSRGVYTFTAKEDQDLDAVVSYAKETCKYKNIFLLGFSLGGAIVLIYGATNKNIKKIAAVSAPADFYKIENRMYSPDAWIPTLFQKFEPQRWLTIRPGNPFLPKIKPVAIISDIQTPVLFIAGEKDPTVFPWHTKLLYQKAICPKDYKLYPKARHAEDLYTDYPQKFITDIVNWFKND